MLTEEVATRDVGQAQSLGQRCRLGAFTGTRPAKYMERGALVPDDLTIAMVEQRLTEPDAAEGVILDGFPRTRAQAEALDAMLARLGSAVSAVFYLDVDRDELIRRLSGRWLCRRADDHVYQAQTHPPKVPGRCDYDGAELYQREDDKPETIKARLEKQLPPMFEVVDYYADHGVLHTIDGDQPHAEVTESLLRAILQPAK